MSVSYTLIGSPLGWLGLVSSPRGGVRLFRGRAQTPLRRKLLAAFPGIPRKETSVSRKIRFFLKCYFQRRPVPPPPLDLSGRTPFQKKVLREVRKIPHGSVRTYSWLSGKVGHPAAARACGRSLGENPLPLLIPCHRIVPRSGKTGGFLWGGAVKKKLLRLEEKGHHG